MQKEHPNLKYSRRLSQVETIDQALAGMTGQAIRSAMAVTSLHSKKWILKTLNSK